MPANLPRVLTIGNSDIGNNPAKSLTNSPIDGSGSKMADLIGWIGSVAFAICGIPQAWECYKNKSANGINPSFVGLWLLGEVCYVISVLMKFGWVNWMMFNYIANIVSIGVIIFYLLKDNRQTVVD